MRQLKRANAQLGLVSVRSRQGQVTELPLTLYVLFVITLFPLIDLIGIGTGATTLSLLTTQLASRASQQPTYQQALATAVGASTNFSQTQLAHLVALQPVSGYQNSGVNLFVQATAINGGGSTTYGPNTPVPQPLDTTNKIYEYTVRSSYTVGPFLPVAGVPWLNTVGGIGKPLAITWSSTRAAEYASGVGGQNGSSGKTIPQTPVGVTSPLGYTTSAEELTWINPSIYQQIADKGQTIAFQDVLSVPGQATGFTTVTDQNGNAVQVQPGQSVWLSSHAQGAWGTSGSTQFTAQGVTGAAHQIYSHGQAGNELYMALNHSADGVNYLKLIAYEGAPVVSGVADLPPFPPLVPGTQYTDLYPGDRVGLKFFSGPSSGKVVTGTNGQPVYYPGRFFAVGETLQNYPITKPGALSFIVNNINAATDGTGAQLVTVIVTK